MRTIRLAREAESEMRAFVSGLSRSDRSDRVAQAAIVEIEHLLFDGIGEHPLRYSPFFMTGLPYRAALYRHGRHHTYWIVYTVADQSIDVLAFWHSRRSPDDLLKRLT